MRNRLLLLLFFCGTMQISGSTQGKTTPWWKHRYDPTWNAQRYAHDLLHNPRSQSQPNEIVKQPLSLHRIDIPVVQQSGAHPWSSGMVQSSDVSWSEVAKVEGGNCGYHALYNVMQMIHLLVTPHDQESINLGLSKLMDFKDYANFLKKTVPLIAQKRLPSHDISWLGGEEIELLYRKLLPSYNKIAQQFPLLVIEHVPVEGVDFSEHVLRAIQEFVTQDKSILGIVWNSGARYSLAQHGGVHWVGFVALKLGHKITLYYMNSITGLHPNFKLIETLLMSNAEELQRKIEAPLYQEMQRGIERMELNLQHLQNRFNQNVFARYLGCIEVDGPFVKTFTKEQLTPLQKANKDLALSLKALNVNWMKYVDTKRVQLLDRRAKRVYGVWFNPNLQEMQAFDVSVRDCQDAFEKYHHTWLIFQGRDMQVFDPADVFSSMLHTCKVTWKDIKEWPKLVQQKVLTILLQMIQLIQAGKLVINPVLLEDIGGLRAAMAFMMEQTASVLTAEDIALISAFMEHGV